MDKHLQEYADTVKDREYRELFPDTSVEEAKKDKQKVKKALFQVHTMVYNKELHKKAVDTGKSSYISMNEIAEHIDEKDFVRLKQALRGATMTTGDDGETLVPKRDLRDVLSTRKELVD